MKHRIVCIVLWSLFIYSSPTLAEEPILVIDPHGHSAQISDIMFTPDGKTLISVSNDKTIRLWDVELDYYISERVKELTEGNQHPTTLKPSTISRFPIVQVK